MAEIAIAVGIVGWVAVRSRSAATIASCIGMTVSAGAVVHQTAASA